MAKKWKKQRETIKKINSWPKEKEKIKKVAIKNGEGNQMVLSFFIAVKLF